MISIRPIAPHEWAQYRDLRLKALQDAPCAFGSTWEAEARKTDESWRAQIASAASGDMDLALFAFNKAQACGLVWCKLSATESGVAHIYQMWVHPAARGLGAGNALLTQALAWAKSHGARCVRLGVTHADSPAMRLYRAHGFRPVGDMEPLREGSELMAQAMELVWGEPVAG
ncbi:MAG: GNAT family N-acetyltransferase [Comamonas sp.]|uniref:GNAT family N-acetyltransferase n=1 Tax=Comamonas sp. TaxID=34028 RepID=UPI00281DB70B|nr:GNAT family N-acetyltransferase [Comamonas sp.]MDR0213005.1 GNAT family N-acetyltransferase [Comamonas sp.]